MEALFGPKLTATLLPAALFALLNPNVLLTVGGPYSMFRLLPMTADIKVVAIHAVVYAIVLNQLRKRYAQYY